MAIQAMIFDLDGTLLQTGRLKAVSYAPAKMRVIAVSTPITRKQLHDSGLNRSTLDYRRPGFAARDDPTPDRFHLVI